jgi:hypothetical protein
MPTEVSIGGDWNGRIGTALDGRCIDDGDWKLDGGEVWTLLESRGGGESICIDSGCDSLSFALQSAQMSAGGLDSTGGGAYRLASCRLRVMAIIRQVMFSMRTLSGKKVALDRYRRHMAAASGSFSTNSSGSLDGVCR